MYPRLRRPLFLVAVFASVPAVRTAFPPAASRVFSTSSRSEFALRAIRSSGRKDDASANVAALTPDRSDSAASIRQFRIDIARANSLDDFDRGARDDLRCEVEALLRSADCGLLVRTLSPAERTSEFGALALASWADVDARAAGLWLLMQNSLSEVDAVAVAPALLRAPRTLQSVLNAASGSVWRDTLLEQCSRTAVRSDPARAVALASAIDDSGLRTRLLVSLADDIGSRDADAAARWIEGEPNPDLRRKLINAAAAGQSSSDPVAAIEWTLRVAGGDQVPESALNHVLEIWNRYAPTQAAHFAELAGSPSPSPSVSAPVQ